MVTTDIMPPPRSTSTRTGLVESEACPNSGRSNTSEPTDDLVPLQRACVQRPAFLFCSVGHKPFQLFQDTKRAGFCASCDPGSAGGPEGQATSASFTSVITEGLSYLSLQHQYL